MNERREYIFNANFAEIFTVYKCETTSKIDYLWIELLRVSLLIEIEDEIPSY